MIGRLVASILLSTLSQATDVPRQIPLTVANLGDNFTMTCPISGDEAGLFYIYKMKFGHMIQMVAAGSTYKLSLKEHFNSTRFTVTIVKSLYLLHIKSVSRDDEATYLCQSGAAYQMTFTNGTALVVNDHKAEQKSLYVKQSPQSVLRGDSVTLQCSLLSRNEETRVQCPGEHSAFWFRAATGESRPSVIYTQSNSSCDKKRRSCVYRLSKTVKTSDKGTYYCAVDACGEILFGGGTKVQPKEEFPYLFAIGTPLLVCCVMLIAALLICRNKRAGCRPCKRVATASNPDDQHRSTKDHNEGGEAIELNYVMLDFPLRKNDRVSNRSVPQDCIYAGTRGCQ